MVVVEREPLESGGACAKREVEYMLGGVNERASGEEEWRRYERTDWFGNEGEGCVLRARDTCEAVYGDVVWKRWNQVLILHGYVYLS